MNNWNNHLPSNNPPPFSRKYDTYSEIIQPYVFLTAFDAFSEDVISLNVLKRLINQPRVILELKLQDADDNGSQKYLYRNGVATDFFTLIIQGKVEVTVGQEQLTFEEGPFTSFGTNALVASLGGSSFNLKGNLQYIPDYTVRVVTDIMYLKIPRSLYKQAVRATLLEREQEGKSTDGIVSEIGQEREFPVVTANGPSRKTGVFHETTC